MHCKGFRFYTCVLILTSSLTLHASSSAVTLPKDNAGGGPSISLKDRPTLLSSPVIQQPVENPWQNLITQRMLHTGWPGGDQPLSAASADFNKDGVPDLIISYEHAGAGLLAVYPGNNQALLSLNNDRSPFLAASSTAGMDEAATWIGAGDFNGDDHADVVAARRGSPNLYWFDGDGHGGFSTLRRQTLDGPVTAMVAGEMNRADHLQDVVVAIQGRKGSAILVFESSRGAMMADPETFDVSAPVTSLALGQLDDSYEYDLAAAAGNTVLILHGRDRRLAWGTQQQAQVKPAVIDSIPVPAPISSLTIGNFIGDNKTEIAVLLDSGGVQILEPNGTNWKQNEVQSSLSQSTILLAAFVSGGPHQNLIAAGEQDGLQALKSDGDTLSLTPFGDAPRTLATLPLRLNSDALDDLVVLQQGAPDPVILLSSPAATFVVNSTADTADPAINGICDVGAGACTLRAALQEANATVAADLISFNIAGGAPHTIAPASALPSIVNPVTIDGRTEPGSSTGVWPPTLTVQLNATGAGSIGLTIATAGSGTVISGLVVNRAPGVGIAIIDSNSNQIDYNFIGTNVAGTAALANTGSGIVIQGASVSNTVGGSNSGFRNLISGNSGDGGVLIWFGSSYNSVQGNYFGTDPTGMSAVPTTVVGDVTVAFNCTSNFIYQNVLSGNSNGHGVVLQGTSNAVADVKGSEIFSNLIGTNASGTAALGNAWDGILNLNAQYSSIGFQGNRNIISGNTLSGIEFEGYGNVGNVIQNNFIGTDISGTLAIPNLQNGIYLNPANDTLIGSTVSLARNVVSGNSNIGIFVLNSSASQILGNYVGTNATGAAPVPNGAAGILSEYSYQTTVGGIDVGSKNVVSGNNTSVGVWIYGDSVVTVQGNFIGTDAGGVTSVPNVYGIILDGGTTAPVIGGGSPQARNVISGNLWDGIQNLNATNAVIQGNYIGLAANGTSPLGNAASGIYVGNGKATIGGRSPGEGNVIAFNTFFGIAIDSLQGPTPMLGNSIFSNGSLEVDLARDSVDLVDALDADTGPNGKQNYPFLGAPLSSGGTISVPGSLFSTPSKVFALDFYSSPGCDPSAFGGGKNYLGSSSVTTDVSGVVPFNASFVGGLNAGDFVTATATDAVGNTSEYSACSCYMPAITASSNSPVCSGKPLHLYNSGINGASYGWSGPNSFASSAQNPTIENTTTAASGNYTVSATVNGCSSLSNVIVTVNPSPALFPLSLPNGIIGAAYNQTLTAVGGAGPYTYAVTLGSLPAGLTLGSNGALTGTPGATGTFNFVATLADANGCGQSLSYSITVGCDTITLTPGTLPALLPNVFYDATVTPTGGVGPYTFAVTSGSLPSGILLNINTGEISGTTSDTGNFSFTITVTDAAGCTGSHDYALQGCLFCADFEDGVLDSGWTFTGNWSEGSGNMIGNGASGKALAVASPIFTGCSICSFEAPVKTAGGIGNTVSFFGWYVDSKNNVELMLKQETGRWLLKERINGTIVAKAKAVLPINVNQSYLVHMAFDGTTFTVAIDGSDAITLPAAGSASGTGAFQGKKTTATIGYLHVN